MVRPGYKQTDVGEIPEDWNVLPLGSIGISEGGYAFSSKKFEKEGVYQVVKMSNLYGGVLQLKRSASFLNELNVPERRYLINENNILITLTGTVGKFDYGYSYIVRSETRLLLNQRVARIIVDEKISDPIFVGYLCKTPNFLKQFYDLSKGGTGNQTNVSTSDLLSVILPFPKQYEEQKTIAKALSDVDELIVSLEKLIAKKRDIKTATMQQLLTGKKRLPGFGTGMCLSGDAMDGKELIGEGKGYQQTELGEIPEDWEVKKLGYVGTIIMGQSPSSSNYNTKGLGLPLIQGNADVKNRKTIVRNYTSQITKKAQNGDIILSVRAPVGEVSIAYFDCCIGRGVCAIRYKNDYLYHWLVSFESKWEKYSKGSTFDSISSDELKNINVLLPLDENEQVEIARVLSDVDKEVATVENRLNKTKSIKQGMMQQLLTGRTRLVDVAASSKPKLA